MHLFEGYFGSAVGEVNREHVLRGGSTGLQLTIKSMYNTALVDIHGGCRLSTVHLWYGPIEGACIIP